MKVYIHYEESGKPEKTSKLSIPKSWVSSKKVVDVIDLFVEAYNKLNPDHVLVSGEVHLQTKDGIKVFSDVVIENNLEDLFDYFIKHGINILKKDIVSLTNVDNNNKVRCKNYGCNQYFSPTEEGEDIVCCHHTGPPVFHDTIKFWSCCPDKKAYDWDEFPLIKGCVTTCHSIIDPKVALGSIDGSNNSNENKQPMTVLKSISDYNTANPLAASSTTAALKSTSIENRKSTRKDDGTAQCRNKGCNKSFHYCEIDQLNSCKNDDLPCTFHKGQAIFHDAIKYWSCCEHKKCYDFESFMNVPGCMKGFHDDGVIDLEFLNKTNVSI